jgi:AcrR family transcriptional regulator
MARPVEKRVNIERGVVEVIARKGLHATTIQDIANASSVSPGLLYRYWENRDALAADVYREHYDKLVERLLKNAIGARPVWERVDAVIAEFFRFAEESPTILKFLLLSQHEIVPNLPPERGVRRLVGALIADGMAAGEMRRIDPELAMQFFLGVVLQPVVGFIYGSVPGPLTAFLPPVLDALRRVLMSERQTAATKPRVNGAGGSNRNDGHAGGFQKSI